MPKHQSPKHQIDLERLHPALRANFIPLDQLTTERVAEIFLATEQQRSTVISVILNTIPQEHSDIPALPAESGHKRNQTSKRED